MSKTATGGSPETFRPDPTSKSTGSPAGGTIRTREKVVMSAEERPYITCRELLDFLHLYLAGELAEDRRLEFDRHLSVCDPCREYIRQYEDTIRLGREAFVDPDAPIADTPEDLVRAVLEARRRR
jgi:anti-sigma factor RsiW